MHFIKSILIIFTALLLITCSSTPADEQEGDKEPPVDETANKVGIRFVNNFKTVAIKEGVIVITFEQWRTWDLSTNINMTCPFTVYSGVYNNNVSGSYNYFDPGEDIDFHIKCVVSYPKTSDPDRIDEAWYNFRHDFAANERYKLEMNSADSLQLTKLTKE